MLKNGCYIVNRKGEKEMSREQLIKELKEPIKKMEAMLEKASGETGVKLFSKKTQLMYVGLKNRALYITTTFKLIKDNLISKDTYLCAEEISEYAKNVVKGEFADKLRHDISKLALSEIDDANRVEVVFSYNDSNVLANKNIYIKSEPVAE